MKNFQLKKLGKEVSLGVVTVALAFTTLGSGKALTKEKNNDSDVIYQYMAEETNHPTYKESSNDGQSHCIVDSKKSENSEIPEICVDSKSSFEGGKSYSKQQLNGIVQGFNAGENSANQIIRSTGEIPSKIDSYNKEFTDKSEDFVEGYNEGYVEGFNEFIDAFINIKAQNQKEEESFEVTETVIDEGYILK